MGPRASFAHAVRARAGDSVAWACNEVLPLDWRRPSIYLADDERGLKGARRATVDVDRPPAPLGWFRPDHPRPRDLAVREVAIGYSPAA